VRKDVTSVLVIQSDLAFPADIDEDALQQLARAVLAGEGVRGDVEIGLLLTDDDGIRAINREYRNVDAATDVLSFSLVPDEATTFVTPPGEPVQLGDIVISYERSVAQAQERGHTVRQEISELFVHGLLHILGYDHETASDAEAMARAADTYI